MAYPAFAAAMQTLQTLHQELDVPDAARSQLDIQLILPRSFARELFADAFARGRHGLNQGKVQRCRVNERLNKVQQFLADAAIPCGNAGFDQHLQFPIARALGVILFGCCQRDADITQAALRPEAQIYPITKPRRRVGGKQSGILIGDFFEKFLVGDFLRTRCLSVSAIEEHQINIGTIVQLASAELAESNHRKYRRYRLAGGIGGDRRSMTRLNIVNHAHESSLENGIGQIRQLFSKLGEWRQFERIPDDNAQQLLTAEERQVEGAQGRSLVA